MLIAEKAQIVRVMASTQELSEEYSYIDSRHELPEEFDTASDDDLSHTAWSRPDLLDCTEEDLLHQKLKVTLVLPKRLRQSLVPCIKYDSSQQKFQTFCIPPGLLLESAARFISYNSILQAILSTPERSVIWQISVVPPASSSRTTSA